MSSSTDQADAAEVVMPSRRPESRLGEQIVRYLLPKANGSATISELLWDLERRWVITAGAGLHHIRPALDDLAAAGWITSHLEQGPKWIELVPGVEQFIDEPAEAFDGNQTNVRATLLELARRLLSQLPEAMDGHEVPVLAAMDAKYTFGNDIRYRLLSHLVIKGGHDSSKRDDLSNVVDIHGGIIHYVIRRLAAEGLIAVMPGGGQGRTELQLLTAGCQFEIDLLEQGEDIAPPPLLTPEGGHTGLIERDKLRARVIDLIPGGQWYPLSTAKLAGDLGLSVSTLQPALLAMERDGLIERRGGTAHSRQIRVTDDGMAWCMEYAAQ